MKRLILILSYVFVSTWSLAQDDTRVVDSLLSVMRHQEGEEKVVSMSELARAFEEISFDDCIYYGEKSVAEAEKLKDIELIAWTHWKLGIRFMNHYEFDLAYDHFKQADQLMIVENRKVKDVELLMDILNYKGRVELLMGELDKALTTYQRVLEVSNKLNDEMNCADAINNMAYIHFHQNNLDQAMESFKEARQKYERFQDTLSMAQCDNNISNIYVVLQQYDEALSLLQEVIPVFECNGDEASLAHAYQNLGTVYTIGCVNLDSALFYLNKSLVCAENVGDHITLVEDELELANALRFQNNEKEALRLYQAALHSSEIMGYVNGMMESYKNLGIYYNATGDFTTSAVYLKRCMDLAAEKGNQLYVNTVRPYLIADYARLGQLMEMKKELGLVHDNYLEIVNENNILSEELSRIQYNMEGLLDQYDSQNDQIQTLQAQRNHYRLAFFGLLAIALFIMVLLIAYKIVRKNRTKV